MSPMRVKTPSRNGCSGFTLLEVLLAIALFSIGILALSQAFSTGILASADAENVERALNIAQARMEEIKNTAFADLAASGPAADPVFPEFNVGVTAAGTDPKTVDVIVSWNVRGGSTNVTLTTLMANY